MIFQLSYVHLTRVCVDPKMALEIRMDLNEADGKTVPNPFGKHVNNYSHFIWMKIA